MALLRLTSPRVIGLSRETHDRREHRRAMNVLAILPSVYVCRADLQRLSRSQDPGPRRQFITNGRRQSVQLILDRQHGASRRHQRVRRIAASTVRNRSGHSCMKVIVLLR